MNELGLGRSVSRVRGHADRHGRPDRLARRLDVDRPCRHLAPDPLGDLERLVERRVGQKHAVLLAAEAGGHVLDAQVGAKDLGDGSDDAVAGQVAVGVVDLTQQIEVDHHQRQRPVPPPRPFERLGEDAAKVAGVVETGLGIDPYLGLERRYGQRALDQRQRHERERHEHGVVAPERRDRDPRRDEHEVGRVVGRGEDAELAEGVSSSQVHDLVQQQVIDDHEGGAGGGGGKRKVQMARPCQLGSGQIAKDGARGEDRDHRVAGVEDLDVPGPSLLEPVGDELRHRHEHGQLRRQKQHRGDDEDHVDRVALVLGRDDDEHVRDAGAGGQDGEGQPGLVAFAAEPGEEPSDRNHGAAQDEKEEKRRARRQPRTCALACRFAATFHGGHIRRQATKATNLLA